MEKTVITSTEQGSARSAAINGLAVVGFITLVFLGILLAIYAARYVPSTLSRLVAFSRFGNAGGASELTVVPTTTLPFPVATSTATSTKPAATTTPAKPAAAAPAPIQYRTVITDYPTPGSTPIPAGTQNLYGLPNLTTTITAVGYIDEDNNFVADKTIDRDDRLAVEFRVTNTGTNASGIFTLQAILPTKNDSTYEYVSDPQHSLNPGGYNDYVIHLDSNQARVDDEDEITITVDQDEEIDESNERDNEASATISVDS